MIDIPQVSAAWLLVSTAAAPVIQWGVTTLLEMRREKRSADVSVSHQMASMIELLQTELDRVNKTREGFAVDLERLRTARWAMEDLLQELRDAAIAARAMTHELERKFGLPETVFTPLPHPTLGTPRAPPAR